MTRRIYVYSGTPAGRALLRGRVIEAARHADIGEVTCHDFGPRDIEAINWEEAFGCILGPELDGACDTIIDSLRSAYPLGAVALLLNPTEYATRAVGIRRTLAIDVCSLADTAHLSGFLLSTAAEPRLTTASSRRSAVIGVCHLKGGVGASTLSAALGACWARHGRSIALIDLDDVNPHLTEWAGATPHQRAYSAHCLRRGDIDPARLNELLAPIDGFNGTFVVVPQPAAYHDAFHSKADVIADAPSASAFITATVDLCSREFDIVVFDLGRSWGVGTFAALRRCTHVALVVDDDHVSLDRTLANLIRLRTHSDDPDEFNFERWSIILNGYTGRNISADEVATLVTRTGLFPTDANLYTVPYAKSAERWSGGRSSLYELCDQRTREVVRRIACNIVTFPYELGERAVSISTRLRRRLAGLS